MKKRQYEIVTNPQNPASDNHSFSDEIEEGIFVLKLNSGKYFIDYSSWVAKTMREMSFGIFRSNYLQDDRPIEFVEFYRLGTSLSRTNNYSPEMKLSKQSMLAQFQDSILINYAQRYGIEQVVSSRWMVYGKDGHENKTAFVDSLLKPYNYQEILTDAEAPKEGSLN